MTSIGKLRVEQIKVIELEKVVKEAVTSIDAMNSAMNSAMNVRSRTKIFTASLTDCFNSISSSKEQQVIGATSNHAHAQ